MNPRLQQKILANIVKSTSSECWIWKGQISNSGYGKIMVTDENNRTRTESADHVSYMAFVGPIPEGMLTRQTCNNRLCVNPEHLELFDPEAWRKQHETP
jgi:hypothetical protein